MTSRSSISAYYIACLDQGPDKTARGGSTPDTQLVMKLVAIAIVEDASDNNDVLYTYDDSDNRIR